MTNIERKEKVVIEKIFQHSITFIPDSWWYGSIGVPSNKYRKKKLCDMRKGSRFVVTFVKHNCMGFVQLLNSSKLDVLDDGVDERV